MPADYGKYPCTSAHLLREVPLGAVFSLDQSPYTGGRLEPFAASTKPNADEATSFPSTGPPPATFQLPGVGVQYADKVLTCRDCGATFTFTSGEQEFYASRGFDNPPGRCPACRAARKAERGAGGGYGTSGYAGGSYAAAPRRELFSTTCASCGGEARVPFQPRGDKPVYCSDCFETQRGGSRARYP
jgi:CxxC-x17-CxxC domain-containing protein